MLMGGVIIQNDVDALAQRNFAVDLLEEFQPLAVGMFLCGVSDDFALQVIQRGKESDGAVAIVVMGLSADMSFAQEADPVDCAAAPGSGTSRHNRAPLLALED